MDTTSEKPEVMTSAGTQASPVNSGLSSPPSSTQPSPLKARRLKRKIVGVFVLLLAVGFAVYANFETIRTIGGRITPTPSPRLVLSPTAAPTVMPELTIINTPPYTDLRSWLIKPDKSFFSLGGLPKTGATGRKDVTATLYSPVDEGVYLCRHADAESVFLEKKADSGWIRLCDKSVPTVVPNDLHCEPYNPVTGVRVYATFYPVSACSDGGTITSGEYQIHAKIYTNCEVDGMRKGHKCSGVVDLISPRITVAK